MVRMALITSVELCSFGITSSSISRTKHHETILSLTFDASIMMMQPVMRTCFEVYVLNIPVLGGGRGGKFFSWIERQRAKLL